MNKRIKQALKIVATGCVAFIATHFLPDNIQRYLITTLLFTLWGYGLGLMSYYFFIPLYRTFRIILSTDEKDEFKLKNIGIGFLKLLVRFTVLILLLTANSHTIHLTTELLEHQTSQKLV
jgi:hypothetical protein